MNLREIQNQTAKRIKFMALSISAATAVSVHPKPFPIFTPRHSQPHTFFKLHTSSSSSSSSCSFRTLAQSDQGAEAGVSEESPPGAAFSGSSSSARTQLDFLDQLTSTSSSPDGYESDGRSRNKLNIRDQLAQLVGDRDGDFSIPLGKNLKKVSAKFLTVSQKRNIKRQSYLNEVSRRNDSNFFATIGAFVLVPPIVILGIAIATGYVQLFP